MALAWALRFLWGYALALLAFWAKRADALLALQDGLIFLLAGQVASTRLLPGLLQKASAILPFRYIVGFPGPSLEALVGTDSAVSCSPPYSLWVCRCFSGQGCDAMPAHPVSIMLYHSDPSTLQTLPQGRCY